MTSKLKVSELVFDEALYPRQNVDLKNILSLVNAMEGGQQLPPIVVCRSTKKIIDGVHRYHAALRTEATTIEAELRDYKDDAERFAAAVELNSAHGLRLREVDSLKVIAIGESFGLKEIDLARILHTSVGHLQALKPRYAFVDRAYAAGGGRLQKIALKGPVRHLSGETITGDQADAMQSVPGTSYLLLVRQLQGAIKHNLLPLQERHPTLWAEMATLRDSLIALL